MSVGKIGEFKVHTDDWRLYVERLEQYFLANDIAADKQVPTLITVMGAECYELLVNLCTPKRPNVHTFKELTAILEKHLQPKPSILAERYKFRHRKQDSGESVAEYVAVLKRMSKTCEFGSWLEDSLRDQFVCGIGSEVIRQRLFTEEKLDFARAFSLAVSMEAAEKNAAVVEGRRHPEGTVRQVDCQAMAGAWQRSVAPARGPRAAGGGGQQAARARRPGRAGRGPVAGLPAPAPHAQAPRQCSVCGGSHPEPAAACKFVRYACRVCNRVGHLQRVCPNLTGHHHVDVAAAQAADSGSEGSDEVLGSKTEWHFAHNGLPHARPRRSIPHTRLLKQHPLVYTAVQQPGFKRVKRGFRPLRLPETIPAAEPRDPYFPLQWYLKNTGQNGGKPKLDLNVEAAWALGYTGVNVTTAIMDDGVDYMHPDLKYNYNAEASYDFSSNDPYPYPRYTDDWFNSHGTRCAGEVAAARDNGVCGVGVAYHSKVAGIRMLDQPYMTDLIEANSMGHEPHKIHIYSASWGPTDDGRTVDGPRNATMRAIVKGVNEGRNGLGNIYVWASGDGGEDDDCNCDGYAASMWTVSINSAINDGQNAHYDESCSSTLASTFSNGARDPSTGVATTDLYGKCTATHSGTSAAAPEAAGVFALALHANPNLTWRDIQHLTVLTSKRNSLYDAKGRFHWTMNGVGLEFNHLFGFGVMDAGAMTALAANWRSVPPRYHCEAGSVTTHTEIPSEGSITLRIETSACRGSPSEVRYLEHVQAVVSANATRRGDLELFLTSPMGTRSMILSRRANDDDSKDGFAKWPFMTTHTWGEYPQGNWTLEARFNGVQSASSATGWLRGWSLVLHGTRAPPYAQLQPQDPHSKLAVVKKAHEDALTK